MQSMQICSLQKYPRDIATVPEVLLRDFNKNIPAAAFLLHIEDNIKYIIICKN